MKRYCIIFLAALAALVSCQKETQLEGTRTVTIKAGALTKTVLDENKVLWEANDKIAVGFLHPENGYHINRDFQNKETVNSTERATFSAELSNEVSVANGYNDLGFAVYPTSAISDNGEFVHNLLSTQVAKENGSFSSECGLVSAPISLKKLGRSAGQEADFKNALSILRIDLTSEVLVSEIKSITLTGTAPLSGTAPLEMCVDEDTQDYGRLIVVKDGAWTESSNSVTLLPAEGKTFENKVYNVLVWPGEQAQLTLTLDFNHVGEQTKFSTTTNATLKPAKYYQLKNVGADELLIEELNNRLEDVDNRLEEAEKNVAELLAQVQSLTLMTEYLDNAVYAPYGTFNNGLQKLDLSLDYIVKPESAAEALVEAFREDPSVVCGVLAYRKSNGVEQAGDITVNDLVVNETEGVKYVTASVSAASISKDFYDGKHGAMVALNVKSVKTDILSDFANLVPKAGSAISGSYLHNIPVIPGTRVVIPFNFAVSDASASFTVKVASTENVDWATVNYNTDFRTGNLSVQINGDKAIESQNVTIALTIGDGENAEVVSHTFTFVDSGSRIDFVDPGKMDYIGGQMTLDVTTQDIKNYMLSCSGAGVSQSGNVFTFTENTGAERTVNVECQATISSVSLNFYKSITLTQKAYGTSLSKTYYTNGQKVVLNQATAAGCSNYFNIVILGDGYQKKDLAEGGKFEKSARSAMDSFFSIEPYKSFKDRFNVYMVAYESVDEGTDIKSSGVEKNTYFGSYCQGGGNTAAYVDDTAPVINAVKAAAGSGDAQYYRSIAILLINTDEPAGSTGYPYRDANSGFVNGYSSFAIAALAANSTGTNGLIKHEAGGHAFGRLADEYYTNGQTASLDKKTDLSNWHAKGWYWNVNPSNSGNYYKFTNSAYSSSEVSFIEGGWNYEYGIYRPTQGGMMSGSTGVFNAPSRHAIYHRIITETEGANAYSWSKFLEYDQKNR